MIFCFFLVAKPSNFTEKETQNENCSTISSCQETNHLERTHKKSVLTVPHADNNQFENESKVSSIRDENPSLKVLVGSTCESSIQSEINQAVDLSKETGARDSRNEEFWPKYKALVTKFALSTERNRRKKLLTQKKPKKCAFTEGKSKFKQVFANFMYLCEYSGESEGLQPLDVFRVTLMESFIIKQNLRKTAKIFYKNIQKDLPKKYKTPDEEDFALISELCQEIAGFFAANKPKNETETKDPNVHENKSAQTVSGIWSSSSTDNQLILSDQASRSLAKNIKKIKKHKVIDKNQVQSGKDVHFDIQQDLKTHNTDQPLKKKRSIFSKLSISRPRVKSKDNSQHQNPQAPKPSVKVFGQQSPCGEKTDPAISEKPDESAKQDEPEVNCDIEQTSD